MLAERGYAHTKSADIAGGAHVSRGTFYEHFENVADCLLAAYEMAADCVLDVVAGACEQGGEWTERLRRAIDAALDFLSSEPALANLLGLEAPAGVAEIAVAHQRLIERLAGLLPGNDSAAGEGGLAEPRGEMPLVEGVFTLITARAAAGEAESLQALAPELEQLLLAYSPISSMR